MAPDEVDALFASLKGLRLLLAVSGGPDSTALMGLAAQWAARTQEPPPAVAIVDHGLRAGSRDEALAAAAASRALGLAAGVLVWEGDRPQAGLQAAARQARYRLLVDHARMIGAEALVTAHTCDDQAETVLMRLAHGSGVAGLAGMAQRSETLGLTHMRPLLDVSKARLIATCAAHGWSHVDDPANGEPRFARARWRAARGLLAREGLTPERLATLARRAREAQEIVDHAVSAAHAAHAQGGSLDLKALSAAPFAVISGVLARWIAEQAPGRPVLRLERVERCARMLAAAAGAGESLRVSLGGCVLTLTAAGRLDARREVRRRGFVNPVGGLSLGKDPQRP